MTPNERILESIFQLSEMAQARASHIKDYIAEFPEVVDVYKDPSHIKPGTPANEKWKNFIKDFYELYPDDAEVGNKTPGKSFSDSIFPIVKRMDAAANEGKSDKTMNIEACIKDLTSVKAKLEAAGLADTGAAEAVAMAIEGLDGILASSVEADAAPAPAEGELEN
jgi:hypothetical protein